MKKLLRTLALTAVVAAPTFYAGAEITGSGTEADPYLIGSPDDLCKAHTKIVAGEVIYFAQTADIDMDAVTDYNTINGTWGNYTSAIMYDGRYHVISNFHPKFEADGGSKGYYCTSIFGVLNGEVKNLGVVDANIECGGGAGILAAYIGHGSSPVTPSKLDNVYVTGKLNNSAVKYTGAIGGTTGSDVEMTNCFANVDLTVPAGSAQVGALVGRVNHPLSLKNCYTAGTVSESASLVAGSGSGTVTVEDVIAFNTGSEIDCAAKLDGTIQVATSANKGELVEEVKGWKAFKGGDEVAGLPGLNWNGTEAHPYLIATTEDLLEAYKKVCGAERLIHFKQTADVELWGVEEWHPINGGNGQYSAAFVYDGGNHTISGFAPKQQANLGNGENFNYYCTTIFGVLSGTVKNLGIIDCDIDPDYSESGTGSGIGGGIMCGYAGHSAAAALAPVTTIDNVYLHGTVKGKGTKYTGAFCGTTGSEVVITNSYANVNISADQNVASVCGRQSHKMTLQNVYTAGTVTCTGGGPAALVCSSNSTPTLVADEVVSFIENTTLKLVNGPVLDGVIEDVNKVSKAELLAIVHAWDAFSSDKVFEGYPALAWQTDSEIPGSVGNIAVDANGPVEYFNLQGVRVANPENGIFIRRQGNKATKVMVK